MRKDFFFGLYSVNDWEWLWGRTAAQIELRSIDQPITVYKHDDNNKPKPGDPNYRPDEEKMKRAVEKWKERKAKRKYNMAHFLATGEKIPNDKDAG